MAKIQDCVPVREGGEKKKGNSQKTSTSASRSILRGEGPCLQFVVWRKNDSLTNGRKRSLFLHRPFAVFANIRENDKKGGHPFFSHRTVTAAEKCIWAEGGKKTRPKKDTTKQRVSRCRTGETGDRTYEQCTSSRRKRPYKRKGKFASERGGGKTLSLTCPSFKNRERLLGRGKGKKKEGHVPPRRVV